jgi:hypothetical protein
MSGANVIHLDSCTRGREDAEISKLVNDVKAYAKNKYNMNVTHLEGKKTLNYLIFEVDRNFVINDRIISGFERRFPGVTLRDHVWQVPIDMKAGTAERSLSPGMRASDLWMYDVKMIIIYTSTIALLLIKVLL